MHMSRMPKTLFLFFTVLCAVQICTAQTSKQMNLINVGMTYDEVKKVLGKPSAIERGYRNAEGVNVGQLMYVTWVFPVFQTDTTYQRGASYEDYRLEMNGIEVTPFEFNSIEVDSSGEIVFHGIDYGVIDKTAWLKWVNTLPHGKQLALWVEKGEPIQKTTGETKPVISIGKIVTSAWCILFDAASGMVTSKGFFPIRIIRPQN